MKYLLFVSLLFVLFGCQRFEQVKPGPLPTAFEVIPKAQSFDWSGPVVYPSGVGAYSLPFRIFGNEKARYVSLQDSAFGYPCDSLMFDSLGTTMQARLILYHADSVEALVGFHLMMMKPDISPMGTMLPTYSPDTFVSSPVSSMLPTQTVLFGACEGYRRSDTLFLENGSYQRIRFTKLIVAEHNAFVRMY